MQSWRLSLAYGARPEKNSSKLDMVMMLYDFDLDFLSFLGTNLLTAIWLCVCYLCRILSRMFPTCWMRHTQYTRAEFKGSILGYEPSLAANASNFFGYQGRVRKEERKVWCSVRKGQSKGIDNKERNRYYASIKPTSTSVKLRRLEPSFHTEGQSIIFFIFCKTIF